MTNRCHQMTRHILTHMTHSLHWSRIIEARLVHYSLQAYSMFGVYIIYSFIIYRVRHKWVLCAPQICISFLWLACKKIWWSEANFGGKFKQSMLLWHKAGSKYRLFLNLTFKKLFGLFLLKALMQLCSTASLPCLVKTRLNFVCELVDIWSPLRSEFTNFIQKLLGLFSF